MLRIPDWAKKRDELWLPYIDRIWRAAVQKCEVRSMKNARFTDLMLNKEKREHEIVFSLTSFPARIDSVYLVIKSLMLQSVKADRIILWLAQSQFPDEALPDSLTELEKYGLTVRFCDEDILSHKKYFYVMQEYTDSIIITFDDDIIYGRDVVKRLVEKHNRFPDCIVADSARLMLLDENGEIAPYRKWKCISDTGVNEPSLKLMALTGSGCLYPPHIMPESTFDRELMKQLAFTADDLWMKYNELLADIPVIKSYKNHRFFILTDYNQNEKLSKANWLEGGNDKTVNRLFQRSPELLEKLK